MTTTYSILRFFRNAILLTMAIPSLVLASPSPESIIKNHFKTYIGETPDDIRKTDYGNLYEVRIGTDIVYTDPNGLYLIAGNVINLESKKNLTEERINQISKIDFNALPKQLAIKIVKGNGSVEMAIFSDPNCSHCKHLEKNLRDVDNVTIYLFPLSILSESSKTLAENVWCSNNPTKSWQNWMLNGIKPVKTNMQCTLPNDAIKQLADKLNVRGTPTLFFSDGTRVPGALEAQDINFKLKTLR